MRYFIIVSQTLADGTHADSMHAYDDVHAAMSEHYQALAFGAVSDQVATVFSAVLSDGGDMVAMDTATGKATTANAS